MGTSIDKKIVEMELRNRQFERASDQTMSTLDKLKQKLNFKGIGDSLGGLDRSIKRVDFAPMARGVDAVVTKFNAMGVVGATVISNLTNKAVNMATTIAKSMTITPVLDGMKEYETKMGSIQTILTNTASKGTTMRDVTDALDELNEYADKTIYNFAEMTKNIGTFTAAGVDLERATTAIKGIANLGAGSGSTPAQVASAMYQLSQALSAGRVTLQDWNSVVNAGMGGELFKNKLIEVAKKAGKDIGDAEKNFRDSISTKDGNGWLDAETLLTALTDFANDPTLIAAATEVKTLTQLIDTLKEALGSGWSKTWEYIIGDFDQAKSLFTSVNNVLSGIIDESSDARNAMVSAWADLGGRELLLDSIKQSWTNFASIIKAVSDAWRSVFPKMTEHTLMKITKKFSELVKLLTPSEQLLSAINSVCKTLFGVLKGGISIIDKLGTSLFSIFGYVADKVKMIGGSLTFGDMFTIDPSVSSTLQSIGTTLKQVFSNLVQGIVNFDLGEQLDRLGDNLTLVTDKLKEMWASFDISGKIDSFKQFIKDIPKHLGSFVDAMSNFEGSLVFSGVGTLGIGFVVAKIVGFFKNLNSATKDSSSIPEFIENLIEGLKGSFGSVKEVLVDTLSAIGDAFGEFGKMFGNINKTMKTKQLYNIAAAVAMLAGSLFLLALLPADKLVSGLGAISVMIAQLVLAMNVISGIGNNQKSFASLLGVGVAIMALAGAVAMLTVSATILSFLNLDKALIGLFGILVMIGTFAVAMDKMVGNLGKASLSLIAVAIGISILTASVIPLALLPMENLGRGLMGLGMLLSSVTFFMSVIENNSFIKSAGSLIVLSVAIGMMTTSVMALSLIPIEKLCSGLLGLIVLLGSMVAAVKLMDRSAKGAASLIMVASAIGLLVKPVMKLASIPFASMMQGLLGLSALLLTIVVASKVLQTSIIGSAAIVGMALGIFVLAGAVMMLANIPTKNLWMAILAITALFAILLGASALAAMVAPGLGILVIGLLGLGLAMAGAGIGTALFAAAMGVLAVSGLAGFTALSLGAMMLADTIPFVMKKVLQGFKQTLEFIVEFSPLIAKAVAGLFASILATIPLAMATAVTYVVQGFIDMNNEIARQAEPLGQSAVDAIDAIVQAVSKHWGNITSAVGELIGSVLSSISTTIREYGPTILYDMEYVAGFIAEGFVQGLFGVWPNLIASFRNLGNDLVAALKGEKDNTFTAGYDATKEFSRGGKAGEKELVGTFTGMMDAVSSSLTSDVGDVKMTPVLDMSQPTLQVNNFKTELTKTYQAAAKMEGTINTHEIVEVVVSGGSPIMVQGAGNKETFNSVVKTSNIESQIMNSLKRDLRWGSR